MARMVKKVDLGFGTITVNKKMTTKQLDRMSRRLYPDDKCQDETVGLWIFEKMTIYIAKDLSPSMQWRVLIHEIAEALFDLAELKAYNHKTILLLENILADFVMNKNLVKGYWSSRDAASH